MGARTTMNELAKHWDSMTAEERLGYRVRFADDVLEVIAIEQVDSENFQVRGYQLNGAMADHQRDEDSRVARVKIFPWNLGGVEILDLDEPVERDDPGPPPTMRLDPATGEYERVDEQPDYVPARTEGERVELDPSVFVEPVDAEAGVYRIGDDQRFAEPNWAGDPAAIPKPKSVLDTPVDEWASTAIRMPHALLDRASKVAKDRMIGRNRLLAHLVEEGLNRLDAN